MSTKRPAWRGAGFAALAAGLLLFFPGKPGAAQPRAGITVYEYPNYQGHGVNIRETVPNLTEFGWNDRVSSFTIAPGESWEICANRDFGGRCSVVTGDVADLRRISWNDTISSLRPAPFHRDDHHWDDRHASLVLYEGRDFHGRSVAVDRPDRYLADDIGRTRSLTARGGGWEVCERPDFQGRCMTLRGDISDLRAYGFSGPVGSARPLVRDWTYRRDENHADGYGHVPSDDRRGPYEPAPPQSGSPRLVLYELPNFAGRSVTVDGDATELSGFNDRAMSARAVGTWQLCQDKDFRGRCVTVRGDVPDLSAAPTRLGTAVTSARPVFQDLR
jgi:hypothetical protein